MSDDEATERLVSRAPVRVRRRVLWGECDPAQVVYTPRFTDYAVSAAGWFFRTIVNVEQPDLNALDIGTPMKAMSFEFHHVLRPDDLFDMTVVVRDLRTRSLEIGIEATGPGSRPIFGARLFPIMIDRRSFTSVAIPEVVRARVERYRALCDAGT